MRRPSLTLHVVLALSLLLVAGCAGEQGEPAATTDSSAPSSAGGQTTEADTTTPAPTSDAASVDLAEGLLPADSFAEGATATALSADDLAAAGADSTPPGAVITPPECDQPSDPPDELDMKVGQQVVTTDGLAFLQLIAAPYEGTAQDARFTEFPFGGCTEATLALPDGIQVVQRISEVDLAGRGEASIGFAIRSETTVPGQPITYGLILSANVLDGDRVITLGLVAGGAQAPTDADVADLQSYFVGTLDNALQYQQDVLG